HDDHSVVSQGGPGGSNGHFLAAASAGGSEHAGDLAMQRALGPKAASLVEEVAHLPGHVAEAGRRTEDDRVVIRQLGRAGHLSGLVDLAAGVLEHLCGHGFGHPLDGHFGALNAARAFGDGVGHGFDVTVHGVIKHKNLCHFFFLSNECLFNRPAFQRASTITTSLSSTARTRSSTSSRMATPSPAVAITSPTSIRPLAGTR